MKPFTLAVSLCLGLALGACSADTDPGAAPTSPSPSPTPTASPGSSEQADVYYQVEFDDRAFLSHEVHEIVVADEPGALERVVEVVDGEPADPDHFSGFNAEAEVRALELADGVATVDWNAAVLDNDVDERTAVLAVQQVVWTLRELPEVAEVRFTVEGEARGRASNGRPIADWWGHFRINEAAVFGQLDDVLEPITILEPAEDDEVSGKTVIRGDASVFEATVVLRILDPGREVVAELVVNADEGAPGRGDWRRAFTFPEVSGEETWTIEAVEEDAEGGGDFFVQSRQVTVVPV